MQRLSHTTHQANRLRGGTVFSVAAKAGAAGSLASPSGGGFGQARYQTAPAAGRWGGGGRGCEYPGRPARQARHRNFPMNDDVSGSPLRAIVSAAGSCLITLIIAWPVLVIGLAIADPPPVGVFAYLMEPREMPTPQ